MRFPRQFLLTSLMSFHLMWRMHNLERLLADHKEKRLLLDAIKKDYIERCKKGDFKIHAFCIMSNHVHEIGTIGAKSSKPFSDHMRRAHSRFGQGYNERHNRKGAVACDRPKTKPIEDEQHQRTCMLYIDCNPVRAGLTNSPTDVRYQGFSSCRYYCYGERGDHTEILTPPDWYLRLGKDSKSRQAAYRSLLDEYMVESGLKRDPKQSDGVYLGSDAWVDEMRRRMREARASGVVPKTDSETSSVNLS